jgi:WbqC-like protein family
MSKILLETQYFPPIAYFSTLLQADSIVLEACEHFQKGSFRNRCYIATSMGVHTLSVPLKKGKNTQQPIREVAISYDAPWQKQHWQALRTAYGSAPFWEHYSPVLEKFFTHKYSFLFDLNFEILESILKILKTNNSITISFSNDYTPPVTANLSADTTQQRINSPLLLTDFRNTITPKNNNFDCKKYAQLFEDRNNFIPNLSILDLIFCCGNQAKSIL